MRFCFIVLMAVPMAAAQDWQLVQEESVFALITHKRGIASGLAHNHFVTPTQIEANIQGDAAAPESLQISFSFDVNQIIPDLPEPSKKWFPMVKAAGIHEDPFSDLGEKDRGDIRKHMLAKGQLNAKKFSKITAELISLKPAESSQGELTFTHAMEVKLNVKGKDATVPFKVNLEADSSGEGFVLSGVGASKFTDLGIKPYSAFLGALANADKIDFLISIKAKKMATN